MISLFVRSYYKDFEWLSYSVKSMRMNLLGIADKVLCVPEHTQIPEDISSFFDKIVYSYEQHPGYISQQVDKVRAYQHCDHDNILFSDSDCIYYKPYHADRLVIDNKVIVFRTLYSVLRSDKNVFRWQKITHNSTGIFPEWEYMRCIPIMHKASTCKFLDELPVYNNYLSKVKNKELSEFNALGIVADTYFSDKYIFINTDIELPTQVSKQYWSWGGITPEIRKELESL